MNKKSILIKELSHKELAKLAKTFGSQYGDFVEAMILYFKKTGINPHEAVNENPAAMLKVLDKRIVSFLKVQERDILKPLRVEVYENSEYQKKQIISLINELINIQNLIKNYRKWVQEVIIKIDGFDLKRTKTTNNNYSNHENKILELKAALIEIATHIDKKNKAGLIIKLNNIFNNAN